MVYKYECNAMRKDSSFLPHSSVQLSASAESRQQSVCVCRRAQLFFYLRAKEAREEGDQVAYLALDCRDQQKRVAPDLIRVCIVAH